MKKKAHPKPAEYRVRYCINGSAQDSTQYYSVFHSSEALEFLAHTFRSGHIHGGSLNILEVEELNRFTNGWENRTVKAVAHAEIPEMTLENGQLYFKQCQPKKD